MRMIMIVRRQRGVDGVGDEGGCGLIVRGLVLIVGGLSVAVRRMRGHVQLVARDARC
jgi:hypothetical protein